MRIPAVLSYDQLPGPELACAALDGELQRVGNAFCPVDTVVDSRHRAASIATESPTWAIAEQRTAAWIFGATIYYPRVLHLCVDSRTRLHPISSGTHVYREVVISEADIRVIGGMRVTSPLRTAIDLARFSTEFGAEDCAIIRELGTLGSFGPADCARAINSRRNLPNKHLALDRLDTALAKA